MAPGDSFAAIPIDRHCAARPSPRKTSSVFERTNQCHHGNATMNGPALATGFGFLLA
jgi:hypothetical protein